MAEQKPPLWFENLGIVVVAILLIVAAGLALTLGFLVFKDMWGVPR